MKTNYNKLIKGLLVFLLYVLVPYVLDMFLPSITKSNTLELLYRFMFMFLLLLFYVFIYRDDLKEDIKAFLKNKKNILLKSLLFFVIFIVGYGIISATIQNVFKERPLNNSNIIDILMQQNELLTIFYVFIISLFTEQIVFRKVFKDIINNKVFFIIFSGLIYAIFQIGYTISGINDLMALVLYGYAGIILSYSYVKTDNIITPCLVSLFYDLFVLLVFTLNI